MNSLKDSDGRPITEAFYHMSSSTSDIAYVSFDQAKNEMVIRRHYGASQDPPKVEILTPHSARNLTRIQDPKTAVLARITQFTSEASRASNNAAGLAKDLTTFFALQNGKPQF